MAFLKVSAETWPPRGTTITGEPASGHRVHGVWSIILPFLEVEVGLLSIYSGTTDFSKLLKAECKITFLRIHPEFFHEPDTEWDVMKEQLS